MRLCEEDQHVLQTCWHVNNGHGTSILDGTQSFIFGSYIRDYKNQLRCGELITYESLPAEQYCMHCEAWDDSARQGKALGGKVKAKIEKRRTENEQEVLAQCRLWREAQPYMEGKTDQQYIKEHMDLRDSGSLPRTPMKAVDTQKLSRGTAESSWQNSGSKSEKKSPKSKDDPLPRARKGKGKAI